MNKNLDKLMNKDEVFESVAKHLPSSIRISYEDRSRPWGGFYVIEEVDSNNFIKEFFPHLNREDLDISGKLSPKILIVAPGKRLSWQYHMRRAEIWKLINGEASVATSDTDEESEIYTLKVGDIIELRQGERHRLIGQNNWGVIAEIWRHTEKDDPSDEDDIIRLQDDFGR